MAKCLIIGGGLAGLSSAVHLSKAGHKVSLIEASRKLGGRTYSFEDNSTKSVIDNGQHILMGAYSNTFQYLKIIGADSIPEYQTKLSANLRKRGGATYHLKSPHRVYPLNLLLALFNYKALKFKEKILAVKLLISLVFKSRNKLSDKDVTTWLRENGQTENLIKSLWEVIGVGALNTKLNEASAEMLHNLLSRIFLRGNRSTTIVLPKVPLSKLFVEPVIEYFKKNKVDYEVSEKLVSIVESENRIKKVITDKREITDFDNLILAIPSYSLKRVWPSKSSIIDKISQMEYSSIITIHLWFKEDIIKEKFVGLIGSPIHWLFRNEEHYSIVISAADEFIKMDSKKIYEMCIQELSDYFPEFNTDIITNYKIIKEKRATIKCSLENENLRKQFSQNFNNLFVAGDWINTGLPGTIEGAILSGKILTGQII